MISLQSGWKLGVQFALLFILHSNLAQAITKNFTTSISNPSISIKQGGQAQFSLSVKAKAAYSNAHILLELTNSAIVSEGPLAFEADNQSFAAGETKVYSISWQAPATLAVGSYIFNVGIYPSNWKPLQYDVGDANVIVQASTKPVLLGVWRGNPLMKNGGPAGDDSFAQWIGNREIMLAEDTIPTDQGWNSMENPDWMMSPWSSYLQKVAGRKMSITLPLLPASDLAHRTQCSNGALPSASGVCADKSTPTTLSFAACASGAYDVHWQNIAAKYASYYGMNNAYIRLGHEFDGNWYGWSVLPGEESAYAACFHHVVGVMRAKVPSATWRFVWNLTTYDRSAHNLSWMNSVYPGDDVVDLVGIDIYDSTWDAAAYPFPANCNASCEQSRRNIAWTNDSLPSLNLFTAFANAHKKPFAIPEWGVMDVKDNVNGALVQHGGLDDPSFIQHMNDFILAPGNANNIEFAIYFSINSYLVESGNYNTDISGADGPAEFPSSAQLFQQLFAPYY